MTITRTIDRESAQKIVSDIERCSKVADYAYKLNSEDTKKLLQVIRIFGQEVDEEEKKDFRNPNPAMSAVRIFLNTIDKEVAESVRVFLKKNAGKLDSGIENDLRSGLMRMAGF